MTSLYRSFAILSILVISGCSTTSVYVNKPNPSTAKLDRVLIIGLAKQYNTRSMYEQELSYRLREKGYNMFSSVNIDKEKKDLYTKEEILQLIDEKNIDGVITMRLKDITSKERYSTSDRYISDQYQQHNYFFNYIDTYYGVYNWSYQAEQKVVVEANLFDANDKMLIFQVEATSTNAESDEARAGELTESFAKALSKSGLLKKKEN